jgi:hypothetical protein
MNAQNTCEHLISYLLCISQCSSNHKPLSAALLSFNIMLENFIKYYYYSFTSHTLPASMLENIFSNIHKSKIRYVCTWLPPPPPDPYALYFIDWTETGW